MEPVYFPFTYVSPSAAATLGACFRRTAVYQPLSEIISATLKAWAEAGRFDIRVPVDTDSGKLLTLLNEYQAWASLHEGRGLGFFKTQGGRVPFFDDAAAHRLSTDIRRRAAGSPGEPPADLLFDARVFLALAHEFDSRQGDFQNGLAAYREMEQKLIQDLKGDPEASDIGLGGGPALHTDDPGGHMTEKRLEAFSRLVLEDATDERLFVTTSRAVFETALEKIGSTEEVLRIERMPFPEKAAAAAFHSELSDHMKALLEDPSAPPETVTFPQAGDGTKQLSLTLRRAGIGREAFLNACMAPDPTAEIPVGAAGRVILIGFLDGAM